ncbi:hypothetical protein SFRURICE_016584 [Spodoptera frugiperda]|nr:hypothetical protein SFRURICE_016584 [Spodoptera frugiperda]
MKVVKQALNCPVGCATSPRHDEESLCDLKVLVLFSINLRECAMPSGCGCVWLPPIIFIGTYSLALVETDSVKIGFLYGKMRDIDGFPTIDTSHTRFAHLPFTA